MSLLQFGGVVGKLVVGNLSTLLIQRNLAKVTFLHAKVTNGKDVLPTFLVFTILYVEDESSLYHYVIGGTVSIKFCAGD